MIDLNLNTRTNYLDIEEDEYSLLTQYIISLYFDKREIPEDIIEQLKNNLDFKSYILIEVKQRMKNIICDNSTILFKELVSIINILSFGKDYDIFTNYNFYSMENISRLFRDYEDYLLSLYTINSANFELTFNLYITLIETFNELCILNQIDVRRKKTISGIIDTLAETINILKYKVPLSPEKINILNNILGKLLFYYSHVPFLDTQNKDLKYIIDEYNFLFHKQTDGYNLSKNANFGNIDINSEEYYLTYLNSVTTLLLTLIYKTEARFMLNDDFYDLQKFSEIIESYQENCKHLPPENFNSLHDFKIHLLNNYTYIYNKYNSNFTIVNYLQIIDKLVHDKKMSSENMSMIRNIILYSNDISTSILEKVLGILLNMPKIKNDYFEFYKLSIIDIIIIRFSKKDENILTTQYLSLIYNYIEKNRVASHLLSMYSKINLSLALYHSYYNNIESQEKSKDLYFDYIQINGDEPLQNEYKFINENIISNYGKVSIDNLEIEELNLPKEKYFKIGKNIIQNFFKHKEATLKNETNQYLSDIITHIFNQEELNNDILNNQIEFFISQKIFYGMVFSSVDGLCERNCKLDDIGYEKIFIELIDGYTLKFAYSTVYKFTFEQIYLKNIDYIKQNVKNLLVSYINCRKNIEIRNKE